MFRYDPFWKTLKERNLTQYDLYTYYKVNRSLLDRLRNNKNVEIHTLDYLCTILNCEISDIVEHISDEHEVLLEPFDDKTE